MALPKNEKEAKAIGMLLIVAAVIILAFMLFKKITGGISGIFESVGLKDDEQTADAKANVQQATQQAATSGNTSPWSPNFYKQAPAGSALVTAADARVIAGLIYSSVGYIYDTPSQAVAAIKRCKTQSQVSFVADTFYKQFALDLLSWLNFKFDTDAQKVALSQMIDYVNGLPKYKA